jgi:hypothetical protein
MSAGRRQVHHALPATVGKIATHPFSPAVALAHARGAPVVTFIIVTPEKRTLI